MSKLPPLPQVMLAGALSNLCTSVLIWLLTVSGLFVLLHVPVAAPVNLIPWAMERILYGALAGVLFLVPFAPTTTQWMRGLLVAVLPIAVFLLLIYPRGREGWLGLNLGVSLPLTVTFFWLLWGVVAGWLLTRWSFRSWVGEATPRTPMQSTADSSSVAERETTIRETSIRERITSRGEEE